MHLANQMGIESAISAVKINDLSNGVLGPVTAVLFQIESIIDSLSDTERTIFHHRLMRTPPATLGELGVQRGVSRERIRQVQAKLERKFHIAVGTPIKMIAPEIKKQFGQIVEKGEVERWFKDNLPPVNDWLALNYYKKILLAEMGFTLRGGIYIDELAEEEFYDIKATAYRLADDVGLVNQTEFLAGFPSKEWDRHIPWVFDRIGLHNLHGSLGLKCSAKARTKAALLSIGRPATRSEIGKVCDFSEAQVGAHLSNIPSIVRADKERWGLREWIDDEYSGIAAEIIQRIEEGGGVTTVKRLLRELPRKFNISPNSVRAYMQTAKFIIREGYISMASTSSIQLRPLDDVIDGRDKTGAPYWTFLIEGRYFDGYSVSNVPPEFAKELGCEPDGREHVCVDNLPERPTLSISWRLASTTGASFGYITEPLKQLGLKAGGRARVTIKGPCLVSLDADQSSAENAQSGEADAILERMIQRRKVF